MKLGTLLQQLCGMRSYATRDDIRTVFGDYHNALRWLALFLLEDEELAATCVVDACTVAQDQTAAFHEWLIDWGARATVRSAFRRQRARIAELAPGYEKGEPLKAEAPPLSSEYFRFLIDNSEAIHARLDVLCRFVLVLRGIGKDSCDDVAVELGISRSAVEQAYSAAFETLDLSFNTAGYEAHLPGQVNPAYETPNNVEQRRSGQEKRSWLFTRSESL